MALKQISTFTKRQLLTLVVFSIADFCNAICVSLQSPFYPQEAEKKGATASEYGLVFGIFELVVFLISPFYGGHLSTIGPKCLFNGGIFTTGICAILFGFLDKIDGHYLFISLSFIIRIVEAMGNAAFLTASFAIIANEFPDNVATTFASLETFFGLGLIVGPTVGGALFQIGGYTTPFVVLGSALFLSAIMTWFVLPDHSEHEVESKHRASLIRVLKIPGVLLAACSIIVTSMGIGFLSATLEPHLRRFDLSPVVLGLMFVINGGTYALTAPCWGWLCDKRLHPKLATLIGCVLLIVGFSFIGPAPYMPLEECLWATVLGLAIQGFGVAACLVASFTDALRTAIAHGSQNNLETYGMISGLWTSTFALGAFIGPSVAGFLYDNYGFRKATLFIIVLVAILGFLILLFIILSRPKRMYTEIGRSTENLLIGSRHGSSMSVGLDKSPFLAPTVTESVACERPPGMSGIIACNSYKNRHGVWHRRDSSAISSSTSYSSLDHYGHFHYESTG